MKGVIPEMSNMLLTALKICILILGLSVVGYVVRHRNPVAIMVATAATLYIAALLYRNYSEFISFHAVVAVQGRYIVPLFIPIVAVGFMGLRMYILSVGKLNYYSLLDKLKLLTTLEPREAYERSANYWSSRLWQRSTDN